MSRAKANPRSASSVSECRLAVVGPLAADDGQQCVSVTGSQSVAATSQPYANLRIVSRVARALADIATAGGYPEEPLDGLASPRVGGGECDFRCPGFGDGGPHSISSFLVYVDLYLVTKDHSAPDAKFDVQVP